ncbi:MAG TPA: hypothetical protein VJQ47_06680 [Steroidobacteraceae bacterium]|nr:hypothetical protein [Steroidobacteraceae bacterium]
MKTAITLTALAGLAGVAGSTDFLTARISSPQAWTATGRFGRP